MSDKLLTPGNLRFVKFSMSGLEEYAKKLNMCEENIDAAVAEAVEKTTKGVEADIQTWANKHGDRYTGATKRAVKSTPVKQDGNYIFAEAGIDTTEEENAWHAVFVEYGAPHTAADPGIRLAFNEAKKKFRGILKKAFKKWGLPNE